MEDHSEGDTFDPSALWHEILANQIPLNCIRIRLVQCAQLWRVIKRGIVPPRLGVLHHECVVVIIKTFGPVYRALRSGNKMH